MKAMWVVLVLATVTTHCLGYYCADEGRWLSRDPEGESEGPGLYLFNQNDSVVHFDYLGRLTITSVDFVAGLCGEFTWNVRFKAEVDKGEVNGWIVQRVTDNKVSQLCERGHEKVATPPVTFYEAWRVVGGQVQWPSYGSGGPPQWKPYHPGDNHDGYRRDPCGLCGSRTIVGHAEFVPDGSGGQLPPNFTFPGKDKGPSLGLPIHYGPLPGFADYKQVDHSIAVTWRCCPEKTRTELRSSTPPISSGVVAP